MGVAINDEESPVGQELVNLEKGVLQDFVFNLQGGDWRRRLDLA